METISLNTEQKIRDFTKQKIELTKEQTDKRFGEGTSEKNIEIN